MRQRGDLVSILGGHVGSDEDAEARRGKALSQGQQRRDG